MSVLTFLCFFSSPHARFCGMMRGLDDEDDDDEDGWMDGSCTCPPFLAYARLNGSFFRDSTYA